MLLPMRISDAQDEQDDDFLLEFMPGCPLCAHSDPELERELKALAQIVFDAILQRHTDSTQPVPPTGH